MVSDRGREEGGWKRREKRRIDGRKEKDDGGEKVEDDHAWRPFEIRSWWRL